MEIEKDKENNKDIGDGIIVKEKNNNQCKVECLTLKCVPNCQKLCKKNFCKSKCIIDPPMCKRKCYSPKCTLECPKVLD